MVICRVGGCDYLYCNMIRTYKLTRAAAVTMVMQSRHTHCRVKLITLQIRLKTWILRRNPTLLLLFGWDQTRQLRTLGFEKQ